MFVSLIEAGNCHPNGIDVVIVDVEVEVEVVNVDVDVVEVVVEVEDAVVVAIAKLIVMLFPADTVPLAGEGTKVLLPITWFAWKEYWPGAVMKVMLFGAMALFVFPLKVISHVVPLGRPVS